MWRFILEKGVFQMKKYLSEFLGTLVLTLFGCGVAVVTKCSLDNMGAYVATSLAFGLSVVAMAYVFGGISGGHFNPAVSFAMYLDKKLSAKDFGYYCLSQVLGAIVGSGILALFVGRQSGLGANALINNNAFLSILAEIILTFVFVLSILGVSESKYNSHVAGLVIGLSLVLVHLLGIGLGTGTSVNPARSIGPALLSGNLSGLYVFIGAPMIGAFLATLLFKYLRSK